CRQTLVQYRGCFGLLIGMNVSDFLRQCLAAEQRQATGGQNAKSAQNMQHQVAPSAAVTRAVETEILSNKPPPRLSRCWPAWRRLDGGGPREPEGRVPVA